MTQEALRMALDFVETVHVGEWVGSIERQLEVITAVKKALAQPEQEPEWYHGVDEHGCNHFYHKTELRPSKFSTPLYTTPPQPEQEPVAHWSDCAVHSEPAYPKGECDCGGIVAVADYTALSDKYVALSDKYVALKAQRTWQRLTDEDISEIVRGTHNTGSFVRAIESKLKQKNGYAEEKNT